MDFRHILKGGFSSTNVIHSMMPWFLGAGYIGAYPFDIFKVSETGKWRLKISWRVIIFVLGFSNFLYLFYHYFPSIGKDRQMNQLITLGDYTLYTVLSIGFLLSHFCYSKKNLSVLEKLVEIDNSFSSINITFPHDYIRKLSTLGFTGLFILIWCIYAIHYQVAGFLSVIWPSYICFTHAFNEEWRMCYLFRTYIIALIIKYRFAAINKEIKFYPKDGPFPLKGLTLMKNSNLLFEKRPKQDIYKVCKLRNLHDTLCDVCELWNAAEATPILYNLLAMVILIIANFYYCYSAWYNHSNAMVLRFFHLWLNIFHYLMYGVPLIVGFAGVAKEVKIKIKRT